MPACPICRTPTEAKRAPTPYWSCSDCGLLFQDPLPAKVLHGSHEAPPEAMPEGEKRVNEALAHWLFTDVLKGKRGLTLDIGSAFPWLAHSFWRLGCMAVGLEPDPAAEKWHEELHVLHIAEDFEDWRLRYENASGSYNLITCIHSWEHVYDPLAAMRKVRTLLADDGAWFIRMPDSRVPGHERDFTEGHYSIHPFFHTLTSVLQCCAETGCFRVEWDKALVPGQRDILLRPM